MKLHPLVEPAFFGGVVVALGAVGLDGVAVQQVGISHAFGPCQLRTMVTLLASSSFLEQSNGPILQIATDCVYSGATGGYTESSSHDALDVYGKTKSLGEVALPTSIICAARSLGRS